MFLTKKKGESARKIAKAQQISHYVVLSLRKRRNVQPVSTTRGRPRLLKDGDACHIASLMKNRDTKKKTPKLAAKAINKKVSEWTARRALCSIGLVSSIKQKSQPYRIKT